MPLLEVIQTKQVSASIRLTDSTASLVDKYASFISASADDVVEKALTYIFSRDREFQDYLKTPQASQAVGTLRVRKAPVEPAPPNGAKPAVKSPETVASAAGMKA